MKQQAVQLLQQVVDLSEEQLLQLIEIPPSREKGDIAFPCFQLAKVLRKAPPQIAQELVEKLEAEDLLSLA